MSICLCFLTFAKSLCICNMVQWAFTIMNLSCYKNPAGMLNWLAWWTQDGLAVIVATFQRSLCWFHHVHLVMFFHYRIILQMHVHLQYVSMCIYHMKFDMLKNHAEMQNWLARWTQDGLTVIVAPFSIPSSSGQSILHFCRIFEHVKFLMVNAHWTILQMHVHLQYDSTVKKHHQMDVMKSTQRAMERSNYHCQAILCSSG